MVTLEGQQIYLAIEELGSWDNLPKTLNDVKPPLYYLCSKVHKLIKTSRDMGELGTFEIFEIVDEGVNKGIGFLNKPVQTPMGELFPLFTPWQNQVKNSYLRFVINESQPGSVRQD